MRCASPARALSTTPPAPTAPVPPCRYEWRAIFSPEAHSPEAVAAMQYMVTFFVTDARRNAQSFSDPALFAHYSAFSYPIVSAPDAATSGYQWLLFTG